MIRHRSLFIFFGLILAAAVSYFTDPDGGRSTMIGGIAMLQGVWAIGLAHWGRKALTDYPEADQRRLFRKALEGSTGSGLALLALVILFVGLLMMFAPRAHAAGVPDGFLRYGGELKSEQMRIWPQHPDRALLAALVEQESCVSLRSSSCWNPGARLRTAREEGAGLGQLTRAWKPNGALRFDSLADLTDRYADELSGLSWDTIYSRPDLQLRALVLLSRDSARPFANAPDWLQFGDAAYNGGVSGVQNERRACRMSAGCDPGRWLGHVADHCLKSRQALYAGRSACDINREHVYNVFFVRRVKYVGLI